MRAVVENLREPSLDVARLPPQAIEAEQQLLGGLLLDNSAWDRISDVVREDDFYRLQHRMVFRHIASLIENNKPADALTVYESMRGLQNAVDLPYVAELPMSTPSASGVRRYAEIVRDRAQKRAIIATATSLASSAFEPTGDGERLLNDAVDCLSGLQQRHMRGARRKIDEVLTAVIERIDELYSRADKSAVVGVPTGFVDLDQKTAGLQPGDLIIVAGRPSMGKTALAMNMVEHVAVDQKLPSLVFSLEMSAEQLTQRMIGSVGRLDQHELRTGRFPEEGWVRVTEATGKIHDAPLEIEERNVSVADMRAIAQRIHRERGGLSLIVVDYLQLIQTAGENRNSELGDVTRSLKAMAKDLRVPVVALSQLSRKVEERGNKRPIMSDLRDSGAIEQDADLILMLYREEVYDPETPNKGVAEVIIGKQRNGPIGTVNLTFLERFTRFENFGGRYIQPTVRRPAARNFYETA